MEMYKENGLFVKPNLRSKMWVEISAIVVLLVCCCICQYILNSLLHTLWTVQLAICSIQNYHARSSWRDLVIILKWLVTKDWFWLYHLKNWKKTVTQMLMFWACMAIIKFWPSMCKESHWLCYYSHWLSSSMEFKITNQNSTVNYWR